MTIKTITLLPGQQLPPDLGTVGYAADVNVTELRFVGAAPEMAYKLDLRNAETGEINILDLDNDDGTLSAVLDGSVVLRVGRWRAQLRTVGDVEWHSNQAWLSVQSSINAIDEVAPDVPAEMRQIEKTVTEAKADAVEAAAAAEEAAKLAGAVADMTAAAETLAPDQPVEVVKDYDPETGDLSLTFRIPRGAKGEKGETGPQGPQGEPGETPDISGKMDKTNPTGTGAMSLNRVANSVIGTRSVAMGGGNIAAGQASVALGANNEINLLNGAALAAVALGAGLQAFGTCQIVMGRYNEGLEKLQIEGKSYPYYPLVFGWGTSSNPKNLLWLDHVGNLYLAGNIVTGGTHRGGDTMTLYAAPCNNVGSVEHISDVLTLPYCETFQAVANASPRTHRKTRNDDGTVTIGAGMMPIVRIGSGQVQIYSEYCDFGIPGFQYSTLYKDTGFTQPVLPTDAPEPDKIYYFQNGWSPAP